MGWESAPRTYDESGTRTGLFDFSVEHYHWPDYSLRKASTVQRVTATMALPQ